jgi:hypothetical protein
MTYQPSGKLTPGLVDPSLPFVLNIPRKIVDRYGRPIRGASTVYSYATEGEAMADYRAAKSARLNPLLRDFTSPDAVRVLGK